MNVNKLKELLVDATNDIVAKSPRVACASYTVRFRTSNMHHYKPLQRTVHTTITFNRVDPRIITAGINALKPQHLRRLGVTREGLRLISFVEDPSWLGAFIGDSRCLTMDPEELQVQQALGIKDPNPVTVSVRKIR